MNSMNITADLWSAIFSHLALPAAWKCRRLSRLFQKIVEIEMEGRLRHHPPPLVLILSLYNSRTLFQFGPAALEDRLVLPLQICTASSHTKLLSFQPPCTPSRPALLARRARLDRMEWTCKLQICTPPLPGSDVLRPTPPSASQMYTLVAGDTPLSPNHKQTLDLATYDLSLTFCVRDRPGAMTGGGSVVLDELAVSVNQLTVSYSFLFARLDAAARGGNGGGGGGSYGGWSVHSARKRARLLAVAEEEGLLWRDRYWTFDLVMEWLVRGEMSEAHAVCAYLLECRGEALFLREGE